VNRLGVGPLLAGSTALVAVGVLTWSAAPAFALVLAAAPLVGFGSGAIDAALNGYAARHFGPRHMSWLHAAYAAGAMTGPALMTAVLARGASWRAGYALVGGALGALVPAFVASRRLWGGDAAAERGGGARAGAGDGAGDADPAQPSAAEERALRSSAPPRDSAPPDPDTDRRAAASPAGGSDRPRAGAGAALRSGRVWLQIAIFFAYSGLETAAGQWSYTLLTEARGLGGTAAGTWTSAYWGGLLAGRLVLGFAVERVGPVALLRLATAGALASAALFAIPGLKAGAAALPLLSFSLASIYPGLMSETPRRVGARVAPHAVGFQVSAATAGVALVPGAAGVAAERFGLEAVGWVVAGCALLLLALHERLVAVADRGRARAG
jgi:fucose permease